MRFGRCGMFDKNVFKENFRNWLQRNPLANDSDVLEFCERAIPANVYLQNYWLVEQTVEWFRWQVRNRKMEPSLESSESATLAS